MQVACAKGCGGMIEVSTDVLKEAMENGTPLVVAHDPFCPNDPRAPKHDYRVTIMVERRLQGQEDWEKITQVGGQVQSPGFKQAAEDLAAKLNDGWQQTLQMAEVADQDAPTELTDAYVPDFSKMKKPDLLQWAKKNNVAHMEKIKSASKDTRRERSKTVIARDLKAIRPENLVRP